MFKQLITDPCY